MINCIIVDDEQHAINILKNHIGHTTFLNLLGSYTNPLEALGALQEQQPDLIFLDIHMPHISGMDFIRSSNSPARVILTTAYSEFAIEGFDLEVLDFLLKPIGLSRFLKAAHRALMVISNAKGDDDAQLPLEEDYIYVKTEIKGKLLKINFIDIDYIEGMKNYVAIHHNGIKTLALLNMKDMEERLPSKHFMRVQKSFIIPIRKVSAIEGNIIKLKNVNSEIQLGASYKSAFMENLKDKLMM